MYFLFYMLLITNYIRSKFCLFNEIQGTYNPGLENLFKLVFEGNFEVLDYVPWCQVEFEGNFKSWIMSLSVGWDLKGILSPGLCQILPDTIL
jgi:hypothetical protein